MQVGKGDVPSQRQRRKKRYRGCRVCGIPNAKWCAECKIVVDVLRQHWPPALSLIVDGGFVPLSGERSESGIGYGGAGLVLVKDGSVIASRSCGFMADGSSDAELHAVIRGARWAPGVSIYTDSESTCGAALLSNNHLDVRFLRASERTRAHALAHQLSVDGRIAIAASLARDGGTP
jgi:ribonuclease HI